MQSRCNSDTISIQFRCNLDAEANEMQLEYILEMVQAEQPPPEENNLDIRYH